MLQILTLTENISRMQAPQDFSFGITVNHYNLCKILKCGLLTKSKSGNLIPNINFTKVDITMALQFVSNPVLYWCLTNAITVSTAISISLELLSLVISNSSCWSVVLLLTQNFQL